MPNKLKISEVLDPVRDLSSRFVQLNLGNMGLFFVTFILCVIHVVYLYTSRLITTIQFTDYATSKLLLDTIKTSKTKAKKLKL